MWIRILQQYDIAVMSDKLIKYRVHDENTSKINIDTIRRTWQEHELILEKIFKTIEKSNFYRSFGVEEVRAISSDNPYEYEREKLRYLIEHSGPFESLMKGIACRRIFNGQGSSLYQLNAISFHELSASIAAPHEAAPKDTEIVRLRQANMNLEIQRNAALADVHALRSSVSWRITRPLRERIRFFRFSKLRKLLKKLAAWRKN